MLECRWVKMMMCPIWNVAHSLWGQFAMNYHDGQIKVMWQICVVHIHVVLVILTTNYIVFSYSVFFFSSSAPLNFIFLKWHFIFDTYSLKCVRLFALQPIIYIYISHFKLEQQIRCHKWANIELGAILTYTNQQSCIKFITN